MGGCDELEFHKVVKDICVQAGYAPGDINPIIGDVLRQHTMVMGKGLDIMNQR